MKSSLMPVLRLASKQLKRSPISLLLRGAASWEPLEDPVDGYTVVIACLAELGHVAVANLRLCGRQRHDRLRELILVFDVPADRIPAAVVEAAEEVGATIPVRLVGYDARQHRRAQWIRWGWVYAWLSWSLGIARSTTRAVILHDLDALPLAPRFFEAIYDNWLEAGVEFCGSYWYHNSSNGVGRELGLVSTFELAIDAASLRRRFRPWDLFNKVRLVDGRAVDFDTTLHAQWRSGSRAVRPFDPGDLVHPTQLICSYTDLIAGRSDFEGRWHMLPVLAYFVHLGGDPAPMEAAGPHLADESARHAPFFGRRAGIDGIRPADWAWMEEQIRRLEDALFGGVRPEVGRYLAGIARRAGAARAVEGGVSRSA